MRRTSTAAVVLGTVATLWPASLLAQPGATPPDSTTGTRIPTVEIIGKPDVRLRIPGSITTLEPERLDRDRVVTVGEALRKVSGIVVREEEGMGVRPNIGIRGLNPTRSTKVLLLEDGLPLTIAPYGDNAAYYHPPIERFESIEVIKGSGQILYGPQTVGGVINYLTPAIPRLGSGTVMLTGGSQAFTNVHARYGSSFNGAGLLVDVGRRTGEGARQNTNTHLTDGTFKAVLPLGPAQSLEFRGNAYQERSQVTYTGLREAEWAADPRQNPFVNDRFDINRIGASVAHVWRTTPSMGLRTTAYGYRIGRDWWRQSSNSAQRPNDAADPACAGMANLLTTCGNEGRLRAYDVYGVEPRWSGLVTLGGQSLMVDAGVRAHFERQERQQVNGSAPASRTIGLAGNPGSGLVEDNARTTDAYSGFVQTRVIVGGFAVSPGLRIERIFLTRENRLPQPTRPLGASGSTDLTEIIPGLGVTWSPASQRLTLFGGAHRGFSPPRPEDVIANATGGTIELDPERSWNYELGARLQPTSALSVQLSAFHMDFENQVVAASVAGGTGAALTNAGSTRHSGLELEGRLEADRTRRLAPFVDVALTWTPVAEFTGARFAYVGTGGSDVVDKVYAEQNGGGTRTRVSVTGNRLPYAPRTTATIGGGLRFANGADVRLEAVHIGEQYGDPLNTRLTVADGQQGTIPAATIVNAVVNAPMPWRLGTAYVAVKNAADRLYIVDRTRGLLPGMPRQVQLGLRTAF